MTRFTVRRGVGRRLTVGLAPLVLLVAACGSEPEAPDPETLCQAFALSRCMNVAATECGAAGGATSAELTTCAQFVACRESRLEECAAEMTESAD